VLCLGKECDKCKGRNHFKSKCKKVFSVSQEEDAVDCDQDLDNAWLKSFGSGGGELTAMMHINDCEIRFKLDSVADVNTICNKFVREEQSPPTRVRLNMYNTTNIQPIGEAVLKMNIPCTGEISSHTFIIVPNNLTCFILGLTSIQKMGLVTVNDEKFIAKVDTQKLGDLGEAALTVDPDVTPKVLPCRMVQYMVRLLPDLSSILEPIRVLTRKDQPWIWSQECEQAFLRRQSSHTMIPRRKL
jgi:hypothetical protein